MPAVSTNNVTAYSLLLGVAEIVKSPVMFRQRWDKIVSQMHLYRHHSPTALLELLCVSWIKIKIKLMIICFLMLLKALCFIIHKLSWERLFSWAQWPKDLKMWNAKKRHRSFTSFGTASKSTNWYLYRNSTTNNWISMIANHLQEKGEEHWVSILQLTRVIRPAACCLLHIVHSMPQCAFTFSRKKCCPVKSANMVAVLSAWWHFRAAVPSDTPFQNNSLALGFFPLCKHWCSSKTYWFEITS